MIIKEMLSHFKNQLRPYYKQGLSPHENETLQRSLLSKSTIFVFYSLLYCIFFLAMDTFYRDTVQVAAIPFSFYSEQCRTSRLRLHV